MNIDTLNTFVTEINIIIATIGVVVTIIGVFIGGLTLFNYIRISDLRKVFNEFKEQTQKEIYKTQKAAHRIIASYHITDVNDKIELLKSAIELDPKAFNGYNALGYAYLEKGELNKAAAAFMNAVHNNPDQKEGYFDLATVYLKFGDTELCLHNLKEAIKADPTSKRDLEGNPAFTLLWNNPEYRKLAGLTDEKAKSGNGT
ncbi:MAG: hypothetical protein HQK89_04500 [Nitrospirae bacterium]|nr:hypothetical protein [Nitrospirota bacterium]